MSATVVISGASTRIGRATALHLRSLGFDVVAGVRRDSDAPEGTTPVLLDITDGSAVEALAARIGDGRLAGSMTRALIPALRKGGGRIVNVGSVGGRQALAFVAPYGASKHAMHGFSDSLRLELRGQGIHVALVEPGAIATEIWRKAEDSFEEASTGLPPEMLDRYGKALAGARKASGRAARHAIPAAKVAGVVEHALTARRPRARYLVGADARVQALLERLPAPARDRALRLAFGI